MNKLIANELACAGICSTTNPKPADHGEQPVPVWAPNPWEKLKQVFWLQSSGHIVIFISRSLG